MDVSAKISESAENDENEGELDPRVQGELELLNSACVEINTIENELEKARKRFQRMRVESTQRLNVVQQKLGRCVVNARPYFEMLVLLERAQSAIQKSAADFQESNTVYLAAKKRVSVAEEKMINDLHDKRPFDAAMQEMLNLATMSFSEAEKEKERCEAEHMRRTHECAELKEKIKAIEKEHPKNIAKSRPYFDMKNELEAKLLSEKWNIEDLQRGLALAKDKYRMALQLLEQISEEVHLKRRLKLAFDLPERTPGVGAETPDCHLEMASVSLDFLSDTMSCASIESSDSHLHNIGDGASVVGEKKVEIVNEETGSSKDAASASLSSYSSASLSSVVSQVKAIQQSDVVVTVEADKPVVDSNSSKLTASGHMSFSADRAMFLRMQGAADTSDNASMGSASSLDDLSEFNKDVVELGQSVAAASVNKHSATAEYRKKTSSHRVNSKAAFPILAGLYDKNQQLGTSSTKRPEPSK